MKAMIFAAGLGTRLRPLTNDRPKALVDFKGRPLIEHTIEKLRNAGVDHVVANVHHFADKVIDFLNTKDFGVKISISDERDELLDTGGGLRKAAQLLGEEPFFIHNVDILSDIDLKKMLEYHKSSDAIATVAIRKSEADRYFMQDEHQLLSGWGNDTIGEQIISRPSTQLEKVAFTGIHIVSSDLIKHIPPQGPASIIDAYLNAAKTEKISCYNCDLNKWIDVGTPEALKQGELLF